jgi:hypothetical protein
MRDILRKPIGHRTLRGSMRIAYLIFGLFILPAFLGVGAIAEQARCGTECQEQYVRQFAAILLKSNLSMADYFILFSEPEGPESARLYITEKKQLIVGEDKNHVQEMTLAGDAFDEVQARNKKSRSPYLTCLHNRYSNRLPNNHSKLARLAGADNHQTIILLSSEKSTWKFFFSDGERDGVVAPDGINLGFVNEDPCVFSKLSKSKSNYPRPQ